MSRKDAVPTPRLGLDPATQNVSNTGRPIPLVEKSAKPIAEVLV